jgi:outer membrane murein-binding lipoprotein Lpp
MRAADKLGKNNRCIQVRPQALLATCNVIDLYSPNAHKEPAMKNASTVFLLVMMFCSLGLWGCTHQKNGAYNSKIRELESRYLKLEEDYKVVIQSSDQLRKKVGQLETQRADLANQLDELKNIARERDQLRIQLTGRTAERDSLRSQIGQFRKDVQDLVGRMDTALATSEGSVTAVPASSRKTE